MKDHGDTLQPIARKKDLISMYRGTLVRGFVKPLDRFFLTKAGIIPSKQCSWEAKKQSVHFFGVGSKSLTMGYRKHGFRLYKIYIFQENAWLPSFNKCR